MVGSITHVDQPGKSDVSLIYLLIGQRYNVPAHLIRLLLIQYLTTTPISGADYPIVIKHVHV